MPHRGGEWLGERKRGTASTAARGRGRLPMPTSLLTVFSSSFLLTAPRHSKIPELILPRYLCKTTGLLPLSFQLSNLTPTASFFPFEPFYFTALPFLLSFLLTITNNASIGTPPVYLKPLRSSRRIKASGISDPLSCVCSSLCPLVCRISLFVRKRFDCDLAMIR